MTVSFQIGGSDMPYDPHEVVWEPVDWIGRKHGGGPLVNAKRSVRLSFDGLSYADFTTLAALCNTASHSIKVPHPDTGTYTTFATAYLHLTRWALRDINVYDVEIVADFITVP
jgi:hypothetical protein